MKKADIPKLKAEVLKMLPIAQADIWKTLKIESRDCSTLIKMMIDENLVTRTLVKGKLIVRRLNDVEHSVSNQNMYPETQKDKNIKEIASQISKILPALQSDIWKMLKIERRQCSRLLKTLEENGLIKKTKVKGGTYMVEKISIINIKPVKQENFSALISDSGRFSPCCGCMTDCNPATCQLINNWVLDIKAK